MLITAFTEKGTGPVNEDVYGSTATRFWVLDGATPVVLPPKYSSESDAKYIVDKFHDELQRQGESPLSNVQLLMACAEKIQAHTRLPKGIPLHEQPSFALAIVHLRRADIEITILGDCYVVVTGGAVSRVLTDTRIQAVGNRTRQLIKCLNQSHIPESEAENMLRLRLTENRQLMNRPGGYYVGTFGGEGFAHARTYVEKRTSVRSLLLSTDGFYKAFELGLMKPEGLKCETVDLAEHVRMLRSVEAEGERVCGKRSDDATALFLDFRSLSGG